MTEYQIQPLAWIVKPKGASLFANGVTTIKRDDEGGIRFLPKLRRGHFGGSCGITLAISPSTPSPTVTCGGIMA